MSFHQFVIVLAVASLAACATNAPRNTTTTATASAEEIVAQRATERWKRIIEGDFKSAYEYFTLGTKKVMSYESWELRMKYAQLKFTGIEVVEVTCEEEGVCKADMLLNYSVRASGVGVLDTSQRRTEDWLKSGDQWLYLSPDVL